MLAELDFIPKVNLLLSKEKKGCSLEWEKWLGPFTHQHALEEADTEVLDLAR